MLIKMKKTQALIKEDLIDQNSKFSCCFFSDNNEFNNNITNALTSKHKNSTGEYRQNFNTSIKGKMLYEIELYIESSIKEMHKEIKSIEENYQDEICQLMGLDDKYNIILVSLKEEMQAEIDNIKAQFEEQRNKGIHAIKNKYSHLLNLVNLNPSITNSNKN